MGLHTLSNRKAGKKYEQRDRQYMTEFLHEKNKDLLELARNRAESYQNASPFPNTSFDDFFDPEYLNKVLDEFPVNFKLPYY